MDRMTTATLQEFVAENALGDLAEETQFEQPTGFLALRRHFSRAFSTEDIWVGGGGDLGLDAIAIILNGALVTDIDQVNEMLEQNGDLDATFVFVQAERTAGFDGAKIGNIAFGVKDFFSIEPKLPRNDRVKSAAEIMSAIYDLSTKFKKSPSCYVYYVTTGPRTDDRELNTRRETAEADIAATEMFGFVQFNLLGAVDIQRLYRQTKNAVERSFYFKEKVEIPKVDGVQGAWLGYVPIDDFLGVIGDDAGDNILGSIFFDNVRDWQGYNTVNEEMRGTLLGANSARFVLMNNGVTIIAKQLKQVASRFTIEDFQIVNGCQTSNVVFDQRERLKGSAVSVPLRLIWSDDENVIESVIYGTNRQTELKPEQLYASRTFSRRLEDYFSAFPPETRLYYERRDGQYDRLPIAKSLIVAPKVVIRAFAAMFLEEPHTATKNYADLRQRIGKDIFAEHHLPDPYYVSAYGAYKLEQQYRSGKIDRSYKAARHHILLALRLTLDGQRFANLASADSSRRCKNLQTNLWDTELLDAAFQTAVECIDKVSKGDLRRDTIRTVTTTNLILDEFGLPHG